MAHIPSLFPATAEHKGVLKLHCTMSAFLEACKVYPSQIACGFRARTEGCVRIAMSWYNTQGLTPVSHMKLAVVCFADRLSGQALPSFTVIQP